MQRRVEHNNGNMDNLEVMVDVLVERLECDHDLLDVHVAVLLLVHLREQVLDRDIASTCPLLITNLYVDLLDQLHRPAVLLSIVQTVPTNWLSDGEWRETSRNKKCNSLLQ